MKNTGKIIEPDRLKSLVKNTNLPVKILYYQSISSTNDECSRLAFEGSQEGLVVLAESQTSGHGRFDRKWESPAGNLYMSVLLRPWMHQKGSFDERTAMNPSPLGLIASLAVADVIETVTASEIILKWPNDILAEGKKICGILSTAGLDRDERQYAVTGIGVNLNTIPEGISDKAVTLKEIAGRDIDITDFSANLIKIFLKRYSECMGKGYQNQFREWVSRSGCMGKKVSAAFNIGKGNIITGTVRGLNDEGCLIMENDEGSFVIITAADVTIL
jgi:BirA family biotin operon repressor/biotin-[acetyl-CoA-carboxylase] ligase